MDRVDFVVIGPGETTGSLARQRNVARELDAA